jgi:penicillin-binding protein 1C
MRNVSGVTGAAPAWLQIMDALHTGTAEGPPSPPAGVVEVPAPMREWFIAGTEPVGPLLPAAARRPQILAPVSGAILAVDPDIPEDRQRVPFEARDTGPGHRWVLDGSDLGAARHVVLWPPRRGRHTLVLLDGDRRAHEVAFEVR